VKSYEAVPEDLFTKYRACLREHFSTGEIIFIQHITYMLEHPNLGSIKNGKKWVYNSFEQFAVLTGFSVSHIKRMASSLSRRGIIFIDKLSKGRFNRTNHYSINEAAIEALARQKTSSNDHHTKYQNETIDSIKMRLSITKKTNLELNKSKRDLTSQTSHEIFQEKVVEANTASNLETDTPPPPKIPPTTARDMHDIFKKYFPDAFGELNKPIAQRLVAAFKTKFGYCLKKWENYLRKVATSKYLTGEDFELRLNWLLSFTTIDRINNNEFGVKDLPNIDVVAEFTVSEALERINNSSDTEMVKRVRRRLLEVFGAAVYKSWFLNGEIFEKDDEILFKGNTKFQEDYVRDNFFSKIFTLKR